MATRINDDCIFPMSYVRFTNDGITFGKEPLIAKLPKKYIFNGNATVLIHSNNSKTIVKTMEGDEFDPVLGFLTAYFQKHSGLSKNKANEYLDEVRKKYEEKAGIEKVTLSNCYGSMNVTTKDVKIIEEPRRYKYGEVESNYKPKKGDIVKIVKLSTDDMRFVELGLIGIVEEDCHVPNVYFDNGKRCSMYNWQLEKIERKEDK